MKFLDIKNGLIAAIFMTGSINAMAQSATVSFAGTVTSGTCYLTLSSTSGSTTSMNSGTLTVTLPSMTNSTGTAGLGGAGRTRGATSFYMGVYGCGATSHSTLKLTLAATGTTAGLIDTGVTGIKFQILDSTDGLLDISTTTTSSAYNWTANQTTASEKLFYVRYYSTSATPDTGTPTASMTVTLSYS